MPQTAVQGALLKETRSRRVGFLPVPAASTVTPESHRDDIRLPPLLEDARQGTDRHLGQPGDHTRRISPTPVGDGKHRHLQSPVQA